MKKSVIFATTAALAAISMSAQAAIKLNATRTGSFYTSAPIKVLPLNNAGALLLNFQLASDKKMVMSYSATCGTLGANGWVDIDIVVNGNIVVPTSGFGNAFCSSIGGLTNGSIIIQIQGNAGNNTVQIVGRVVAGASSMQFIDSALLVFD